jgi:spermidine/putrescine transport system substrate-binding protein
VGLALAAGCGGGEERPAEISAYGLTVQTEQLGTTLRLFNFPEYLDEGLARQFSDLYGIEIVQDFFDTNEAMIARLRAGGSGQFDLVVASDYAVQILREAGLLQPLASALLPNRVNLHSGFLGLPYDPDNLHSVPYQWGTTGIGVRRDRATGTADSWADWGVLFDPERQVGRFTLLDDPRETIGAALLSLGHSVNTTDDARLAEAEALLASATDRAVAFTAASTGRDLLIAGEVDVSHNHSGEIAAARDEVGGVSYVVPRQGGIIWTDNLVIPYGAAQAYSAHVLINFLLDAENGARLTEALRYASPNAAAWEHFDAELKAEHEALTAEGALSRLEFIRDVGPDRRKYDEIWTRIRAGAVR